MRGPWSSFWAGVRRAKGEKMEEEMAKAAAEADKKAAAEADQKAAPEGNGSEAEETATGSAYPETVTVSGAGTAEANGVYVYRPDGEPKGVFMGITGFLPLAHLPGGSVLS